MLEVGEEEAHLGCQPVSPRLHETLMDLIDWREHWGGVWGLRRVQHWEEK